MSKKLTFEFIQQAFIDAGCKLLATEYIDNRTLMAYQCNCGNISEISYTHFQQSKRCKKCAGNEKPTIELLQKYFTDHGCILLETVYINNRTLMNYQCICDNNSKISWANFKKGRRCNKCGTGRRAGKQRNNFELIKSEFTKAGCELFEKRYISNKTLMMYQCSCGNISKIGWSNFERGVRCSECSSSKGEKIINKILKESNIEFETEKRFKGCKNKKPLPFDFYIKSLNLAIEFDGKQHFEPVRFGGMSIEKAEKAFKLTQENDSIKTSFCLKSGINLLRISYKDYDNIEKILKKELNLNKI